MRKAEIACNKQFLLFSKCFLPYMALIFHSKCTLKCRLQFISIWTGIKILSSGSGLKEAAAVANNNSAQQFNTCFTGIKYDALTELPLM